MGAYQAAPLFQVSVSWIDKALARRRETGESTARPQINHVPPKLLEHYEAIRLKLKAEPDVTLAELRAWLRETHQVSISLRGIWKTLRRLDVPLGTVEVRQYLGERHAQSAGCVKLWLTVTHDGTGKQIFRRPVRREGRL